MGAINHRRQAVLLLGPPGIGKSITCWSLARTLAEVTGKQFIGFYDVSCGCGKGPTICFTPLKPLDDLEYGDLDYSSSPENIMKFPDLVKNGTVKLFIEEEQFDRVYLDLIASRLRNEETVYP